MKEIEENTLHIYYKSFGLVSKIIRGKLVVQKTPFGIESEQKTYITTKNNNKYEFREKYGIYWNPTDELRSVGSYISSRLLENEIINGDTYIEMMSAEYKVPIEFLEKKYYGPTVECEYKVLEGKELEEKKKIYLPYLNEDIPDKFNNIIIVVKDEPKYSNSKKTHSTINIIIFSKNTSYLIKVAYQNFKDFDINPEQIIKHYLKKDKL